MRVSNYLLATVKETPADAETISHQLMLRAGMIRKLASGLYNWLPLGFAVAHKVEQIVREEMNRAGAVELVMPVVQPAELWEESGRWETMGPELLRFRDRHERDFCLGPTHEEVITDIVRNECSSYRQLPLTLYQIQTKFRDEVRPRFGVMRAREFIMKDAYSFHASQQSLEQTYEIMHAAYSAIFKRLGLEFRAVIADSGNIGGSTSHEFHVLAESGEDEIVFSDGSDYAANLELAEGLLTDPPADGSLLERELVETPGTETIDQVASFFGCDASHIVKTIIVKASENEQKEGLVALLIRGDQQLNETKAQKLAGVASPLEFASDEEITARLGCPPGSLGPVGLGIPVYADRSVENLTNFICGANIAGQHYRNCNWSDDCRFDSVVDLRTVQAGDGSPDGKGTLSIKRGIEVGHIFQLGTKYSEALNATVLDENGKSVLMPMGCYGIGVTRVVAACIEQNHDNKGIIWPENIAPFSLVIIQIDAHKSADVVEVSEALYEAARVAGLDVLLDDRDKKTSVGVKFADSELIGIPHRLVVSPRSLADGVVEYKHRKHEDKQLLDKEAAAEFIRSTLAGG